MKGITTILNPSDKQNVPLVLNLYQALEKCVDFCKNSDDSICRELKHSLSVIYHILDGIVTIFHDPKVNLTTQLTKLSKVAHILLAEYRLNGTAFIPGQLYHDVQRMIQGCFYTCAILKKRAVDHCTYIN